MGWLASGEDHKQKSTMKIDAQLSAQADMRRTRAQLTGDGVEDHGLARGGLALSGGIANVVTGLGTTDGVGARVNLFGLQTSDKRVRCHVSW